MEELEVDTGLLRLRPGAPVGVAADTEEHSSPGVRGGLASAAGLPVEPTPLTSCGAFDRGVDDVTRFHFLK